MLLDNVIFTDFKLTYREEEACKVSCVQGNKIVFYGFLLCYYFYCTLLTDLRESVLFSVMSNCKKNLKAQRTSYGT